MMRPLAAHAARWWRSTVAVLLLLAGQANIARAAMSAACERGTGTLHVPASASAVRVATHGLRLGALPAVHRSDRADESPAPSSISAMCQLDGALVARRTVVPTLQGATAPMPHANDRAPVSIAFPPLVPPPRLG